MYTLYGIKNCDTMKKAVKWLDEQHVEYQFHNYKTAGIDAARLERWLAMVDWQQLVNTRGTTWRKLDPAVRDAVTDAHHAKALMLAHPSLIKRPVLEHNRQLHVGFSPDGYAQFIKETQ